MKFVIRSIDELTGSYLQQAVLRGDVMRRLTKIIGVERIEPGDSFELEHDEYLQVISAFDLSLDPSAKVSEVFAVNDCFNENTDFHTGRELLMMLNREKPLAAFIFDTGEPQPIEEKFKPFVSEGRIQKIVGELEAAKLPGVKLRCVLYTVPGQEWRAEAYVAVWRLAASHGWSPCFEKLERFLLGYEVELDSFFLERKNEEICVPNDNGH